MQSSCQLKVSLCSLVWNANLQKVPWKHCTFYSVQKDCVRHTFALLFHFNTFISLYLYMAKFSLKWLLKAENGACFLETQGSCSWVICSRDFLYGLIYQIQASLFFSFWYYVVFFFSFSFHFLRISSSYLFLFFKVLMFCIYNLILYDWTLYREFNWSVKWKSLWKEFIR